MKNKLLLVLLMLVLSLNVIIAYGCGKNDNPIDDGNKSSISLNKKEATLEVYDELQLQVVTENITDAIIWSSSDINIASVESGLIKTKKVGTTTITAKAGNVQDKCVVTVLATTTVPVLTITSEKVSVDIDDSGYTVGISATWKNQIITDDILYEWNLDEGAETGIVSLQFVQNGVIIKGLKYGNTKVIVSANIRNTLLAKSIEISVVPTDLSFRSNSFKVAEGGFDVDVALVETDKDKVSVNMDVEVYNKNNKIENPEIIWTNSDETIAKYKDGIITAVSEGKTTIKGEFQESEVLVNVNVYRSEITYPKLDLEYEIGSVTLPKELIGEFKRTKLGDNDLSSTYSEDTKILTFDKNTYPKDIDNMGPGKILYIETDKAIYASEVGVYTKILKDSNDIRLLGKYSKDVSPDPGIWSGYFILGNDIEFTGENYKPFFNWSLMYEALNRDDPNWCNGRIYGFKGVLDGCCHNINNLVISDTAAGGFIGLLHQKGIIKNISFTNLSALKQGGGFLTYAGDGLIENVYMHIKEAIDGKVGNEDKTGAIFAGDSMSEARVKNTIIIYDKVPDDPQAFYGIGTIHDGYGILDNVYCVGTTDILRIKTTGEGARNICGGFDTYADFKAQNIDFSQWSENFWKIVNGIPYPKNLNNNASLPKVSVTETIKAGEKIVINGMKKEDIINLSSTAIELGVKIDGSTLIVPDDINTNTTIEFFIYSIFDSSKRVEFKVYVTSVINLNMKQLIIDIGGDDESNIIDISNFDIEGVYDNLMIDKQKIEASMVDNRITLNRTDLIDLWGERNINIYYLLRNGEVITQTTIINIPVILATKVISNKDELLALENYTLDLDGKIRTGYFLQTSDIDAEGERVGFGTWVNDEIEFSSPFGGVYNGNGHSISNTVQATNQGMFCCTVNATVKNLTFYNAIANGCTGIVSTYSIGNSIFSGITVYGSFAQLISGAYWAPCSLIVSKLAGNSLIENSFSVLLDHDFWEGYGGMIVGRIETDTAIVRNCLAVNLKEGSTQQIYFMPSICSKDGRMKSFSTDTDTVHTFHGWNEYELWAENAELVNYPKGSWVINQNKIPVSKAINEKLVVNKLNNTQTSIVKGKGLKITITGYYFKLSVDKISELDGVKIINGEIIIPAECTVKNVTLSVICVIDGSIFDKNFVVLDS